ncbi:MAG: flagellar motor switch protein FliG [Bacillota bacterium]
MALEDIKPEQKAATVIVSLGIEKASKIYQYLSEDEIERLTLEVAKLGNLSSEDTEAILEEFHRSCMTHKMVTEGGMEYARSVLEKAFGEDMAASLLNKVSKSLKVRAFSFLGKYDDKILFTLLQAERPQTIALILSYVESDRAARLIGELPEVTRIQVVEAVAKMDSVSPEAIKLIEHEVEKKLSAVMTTDYTKIGGIDYIADVMNYMDRANEKYILDELGRKDIELAEEIRKKMFVFEDIMKMDPMAIQRFIRDVDSKDMVLAIKGSIPEVSNVIFANMSSRMVETVQSELEFATNIKRTDVEAAQQRIVGLIRSLEESGELVISKGGGDDVIA